MGGVITVATVVSTCGASGEGRGPRGDRPALCHCHVPPQPVQHSQFVQVKEEELAARVVAVLALGHARVQGVRLVHASVLEAQVLDEGARDVVVVHPEEAGDERRLVHQPRHVPAQQEGGPGTVRGEVVPGELLLRDVPLGLLVPHDLHPEPLVAQDEAPPPVLRLHHLPQVAHQAVDVDEDVVVRLEDVVGLRAVGGCPLEPRHGLVGQVAVAVHEVLLHDVAVALELHRQQLRQLAVLHAAHDEDEGGVVAAEQRRLAPRLADALPLLQVGRGRVHVHQQLRVTAVARAARVLRVEQVAEAMRVDDVLLRQRAPHPFRRPGRRRRRQVGASARPRGSPHRDQARALEGRGQRAHEGRGGQAARVHAAVVATAAAAGDHPGSVGRRGFQQQQQRQGQGGDNQGQSHQARQAGKHATDAGMGSWSATSVRTSLSSSSASPSSSARPHLQQVEQRVRRQTNSVRVR